jgi:tripartite-type tricarboxylate transporter receptor subunit TctC
VILRARFGEVANIMQFSWRDLLPLAAGVALLPGLRTAQAESYPSRPIRVIVALPAGSGTLPHVFGELFMMMSAVSMLHVAYRGNFMPDLLSGQVHAAIARAAASSLCDRPVRRH